METPRPDAPADETFPQVLAALKDASGDKEPAIAERLGVHVSTVNNWANGKATPRPKYIRALAAAYPAFTADRLAKAAGRRVLPPLSKDGRAEVLEVFDQLTEEQRRMLLVMARAAADDNQQQS